MGDVVCDSWRGTGGTGERRDRFRHLARHDGGCTAGAGVALAPPSMFSRHLASGAIVQPFPITISLGSYWLTRLQSKPRTAAMQAFSDWIFANIDPTQDGL